MSAAKINATAGTILKVISALLIKTVLPAFRKMDLAFRGLKSIIIPTQMKNTPKTIIVHFATISIITCPNCCPFKF